ncbi:MAG: phosphate acyltransferase PlsX [Clostridia bacterium]|nr:phosphate acyltransferase PlsX [Clostridia bacterium]
MRIAIDAMGGDNAPREIILGALAAKENLGIEICLVGVPEIINGELDKLKYKTKIEIIPAKEVIGMDEHPGTAVRRKKESSIVVATKLVKNGEADALISAGSTGAQMAAALFYLGRIKEVERPAIVTVFPSPKGKVVMLDSGANADAKATHLIQFAQMGSIYAEKVLHIQNPRIGLLNIGSEETKGNELTLAAYQMLKEKASLNFIGNVEGRELLSGVADVIVCDGFVGNVVLKFAEGLVGSLFFMIKKEIEMNITRKIGALLVRPAFMSIKKQLDYNEYGGAPLLGVDGISIICHGSSKAKAIASAVRMAKECVESDFVGKIKETI